jgi:predicted  nucleic acid-binding Zn-ribbon protein
MAQVIIDYQEYQDLLERVERLKEEVQMLNASREMTYRTLKEELDGMQKRIAELNESEESLYAENALLKKELEIARNKIEMDLHVVKGQGDWDENKKCILPYQI